MSMDVTSRHMVVTGLPHGLAVGVVRRLLSRDPNVRIHAIVRADLEARAISELSRYGVRDMMHRVTLHPGDISLGGLGISRETHEELSSKVSQIFHFASAYHIGEDKQRVEAMNIDGTANTLRFAESCRRLEHFHHGSTCFVAGDRDGVVLETELERGQGFRNTWERTRFAAEMLARRAAHHLPVTIYRMGLTVGHSRTGRLGRVDGPHFLLPMLVTRPARLQLPSGDLRSVPFSVVPIDFAADAVAFLSQRSTSIGRTYHVVDPHPVSLTTALSMVEEHAGRLAPEGADARRWTRRLGRLPGIGQVFRPWQIALAELDTRAVFNTMDLTAALAGSGIRCPSFPAYVEHLVRAVRDGEVGWARVTDADSL